MTRFRIGVVLNRIEQHMAALLAYDCWFVTDRVKSGLANPGRVYDAYLGATQRNSLRIDTFLEHLI